MESLGMTAKPPLTLAAIRAIRPGCTLWDHVVTGLHVRRQRGEAVTFNLYYRAHSGARRVLKVGDWPSLTLELARDAARDLLRKVAVGEDPGERKQALRDAPTINDLCDEWERRKAPPVKKPRSFKEDQYNMKNHIRPRLGKLRVSDVDVDKIAKAVSAIHTERGPSAARATRTLLSGLFKLAKSSALGWYKGENPIQSEDVPRIKIGKRRRHFTADEFPAIARELEKQRAAYPAHIACIWVEIYCGSRVTELATAKRKHVHGTAIILDEHKTDATGNERIIRLTKPARDELERLPEYPNGFLFGELGAMGDGARRSIHNVWEKVRDAAGCPDLRLQDIRRTFATVAKSRGKTLDQIGELFGHGDAQTTLGYAWLMDDAAQESAEDIANAITLLAAGPQKSGQSSEAVAPVESNSGGDRKAS
jgi:hypothetical protein